MYRNLARWRAGEKPGPHKVHLVLTERCNLKCLSCFMGQTPARNREREVPDARLVEVLDEAIGLGAREVYLVGGEVFFRRGVVLDLMGRVKAAGLRGDLTTNGTLVDESAARRLVEIGWDRLQISLDGPDAAVNDALRPPAGTFDRVVESFERLSRSKARSGSVLPVLGVSTVLSNRNYRLLPEMVRLAARLGAADITFQSLKDRMSDLAPTLMLDASQRAELPDIVSRARSVAESLEIETNLDNLLEGPVVENIGRLDRVMRQDVHDVEDPFFRAHCFVPWYYMVIHYDGRVAPCWEWGGEDLGNVKEASLRAIWYGEQFERFRRAFQDKEVPDHCAQCCLGYLDHTRWLREMGLLHTGNHVEAVKVAEKLLVRSPHHAQSIEVKALGLYHLGRRDEAASWLLKVADEAPPGELASLAHLLDVPARFADPGTLGELARRLADRARGAKSREGGVPVLPRAALAMADAGRFVDALALLERDGVARPDAPDDALSHRARVTALYGSGRVPEAREALSRGLRDRAGGPLDARMELLFVAHRHGDHRAVVREARAALEEAPGHPFVLWVRAAALGKMGRLKEAERGCRDALVALRSHASPCEDAVHDTLAELALRSGDPREAERRCREALRLNPERPGTRRLLARALRLKRACRPPATGPPG